MGLITVNKSWRRRSVVPHSRFRKCKHVPLESKIVKEKVNDDDRMLFLPYDFGEVHRIPDDETDSSTEINTSKDVARITSDLINLNDVDQMVNELIESSCSEMNEFEEYAQQRFTTCSDGSVISCSSSLNTSRELPTTRVPKLAVSKRDTLSLKNDQRVEWDTSSSCQSSLIEGEPQVVALHHTDNGRASTKEEEVPTKSIWSSHHQLDMSDDINCKTMNRDKSIQSFSTDEQDVEEERNISETHQTIRNIDRFIPLSVDGNSDVRYRVQQWESWNTQMNHGSKKDSLKEEWRSFLAKKVRDVSAAAAAVIAKDEES